jgi:hypothetical protein
MPNFGSMLDFKYGRKAAIFENQLSPDLMAGFSTGLFDRLSAAS